MQVSNLSFVPSHYQNWDVYVKSDCHTLCIEIVIVLWKCESSVILVPHLAAYIVLVRFVPLCLVRLLCYKFNRSPSSQCVHSILKYQQSKERNSLKYTAVTYLWCYFSFTDLDYIWWQGEFSSHSVFNKWWITGVGIFTVKVFENILLHSFSIEEISFQVPNFDKLARLQ